MKKIRVLVVEDEIIVAEDLQQRLTMMGDFEVVGTADTATEAIRLAKLTAPDVVLMDIMLRGRADGIDAAEFLNWQMDIPVVFLTAHSDPATLQRAKFTEPMGYIVKPVEDLQLRVAIESAHSRQVIKRKCRRVARWLTARLIGAGDAVIVTNHQSEILMFNEAAEKLSAWPKNEAIGRQFAEVLHVVDQRTGETLEDSSARALRLGAPIVFDTQAFLRTQSGEQRDVVDSASPILDETGVIIGAVIVMMEKNSSVDVYERLRALTQDVVRLLAGIETRTTFDAQIEVFADAVNRDLR